MRKSSAAIAAIILALIAQVASARTISVEQADRLLAHLTAGEPVRCIGHIATDGIQVVERSALLFRVSGTLYVNVPVAGRADLHGDILTVSGGDRDRLCEGDSMRLEDRASGNFQGYVNIGKFVPFRRPR